jgi:hypothetical protein
MTKGDPKSEQIVQTKRLMGALLRMPPRPHSEMKLRKPRAKQVKSPAKKSPRGASAKPKAA